MAKGTLMTSTVAFRILSHTDDLKIDSKKKFCGWLYVSCNDPGEGGSVLLHVEAPLPSGVRNRDFVNFKYTGLLTCRVVRKETIPCGQKLLEIDFVKTRPMPMAKKPVKKKSS